MIRKKISIFFSFFFLLASLLLIRVSCLGASPLLVETAQKQQTYSLTISKERGVIFDSKFKRLTNSESEFYAIVSPSPTVIDELGRLGTSLSKEKLVNLVSENKPFIADVVRCNTTNKNISICEAKKRYKNSSSAVHILGYINSDLNGVSGIEKSYNDFLNENCHTLTAVCQVDGQGNFLPGRPVEIRASGSADAGIVTTIDSDVQSIVEHASKDIKKGAVVVMDANTAEIRAMASFPTFSPNNPSEVLNDNQGAPMINRTLTDFAVGSTFKIVTTAAALDNGISPNKSYQCTGHIDVDGQIYHCHNRNGHGFLNMSSAFKESCNPYFIELGEKLGGETLRTQAISLGYGREINLCNGISSTSGNLPPQKMSTGELANFSFGQGILTASPIQVCQSIFPVINNGKVITPSLISGTTTDGITINKNKKSGSMEAMSEFAASEIKQYMINTVEGTIAQPKTTIAGGKSGTAQTGRLNVDQTDEYDVWFGGFFPANNPKYIAVVLMEGGTSGTNDTGAIFSKIADSIIAIEKG